MSHISLKTRNRAMIMIVAMAAVIVSSAFGIVWMQQQISRTAQNSNKLESQLAETVRKLRYLDERIATIHQPIVLQGKVAGLLRPSMDNQIVWVRESNMPTGRAYAASQPYEASMDLAFINLNPKQR